MISAFIVTFIFFITGCFKLSKFKVVYRQIRKCDGCACEDKQCRECVYDF